MELKRLRLIIDSSGAVQGAADYRRAVAGVAAETVQATQSITRMEGALAGASRQLGSFLRLGGMALGVREVVQYADTWRTLDARIKLATTSAREHRQVQDELFKSAQNTRTSFEAMVTLYSRSAAGARELGASQQQLVRFTDVVAKAMRIGGASATEARAGLIQLSQALSGGVVRAEEFNSVLEQIPGVARVLAEAIDGAGGSVGKLRKIMLDGQLTSRMVFEGMLRMAADVDARFAKLPTTVGESFTVLQNAAQRWVGETDKGVGASTALAGAIGVLARNLSLAGNALLVFGVAKFVDTVRSALGPTAQYYAQLARGNAVLIDGSRAMVMRAEHAQATARAQAASSAQVVAALRAERAELAALIVQEEAARVAAVRAQSVPRQLTPTNTGAPSYLPAAGRYGAMQQGANNAAAEAQRTAAIAAQATATENLAALNMRLAQTEAQLTAAQLAGTEAAAANTAANMRRAFALQASTGATVALTAASKGLNAVLQFFGGWVGLAVNAAILLAFWLYNLAKRSDEAAEAERRRAEATRESARQTEAILRGVGAEYLNATRQQEALRVGGLKALEAEERRQATYARAEKLWAKYREANQGAAEATLDFDQALKQNNATAGAYLQIAGQLVAAEDRVAKGKKAAEDAESKLKQARADAARELKQETERREEAVAKLREEQHQAETNAQVAGQALQVRQRAALEAKISAAIYQAHAQAVAGDSAAIALHKDLTRLAIRVTMELTDATERLAKARNDVRDRRDDLDVQIAQQKALADAMAQGEAAVAELRIQQAADNEVRARTIGLTADQVAAMKPELDALREKALLLGRLEHMNQSAQRQDKRDDATAAREAERQAKRAEEFTKNTIRELQGALSSFLQSVFTGGVNSFQRLVDAARQMFVRFLAELAALKIGQAILGRVTGGAAGVLGPLGAAAGMRAGTTAGQGLQFVQQGATLRAVPAAGGAGFLQTAGGYAGLALGAGLVGYGVGQMTTNRAVGALAGGAAGAATGAMVGTMVLPGIGTAVGAFVGAAAGVIGGIFGATSKLKEERAKLDQLRQGFRDRYTDKPPIVAEWEEMQRAFRDLEEQAKKARRAVTAEDRRMKADAEAKLRADFSKGITQQLNDATGNGYANQLAAIEDAYRKNLEAVKALGLGEEGLRQVEALRTAQLAQLERAQRRELATMQAELAARRAAAAGRDYEADSLRFAAQQADELAQATERWAATNPEIIAQLREVLQLERAAREAQRQRAEDALRDETTVRRLSAMGRSAEADAIRREAAYRKELDDARAGGASADAIRELEATQAIERYAAGLDAQLATQQAAVEGMRGAAEAQAQAAQQAVQVAEQQLGVLQQQLQATRRAVEALTKFRDDLTRGPAALLSPEAQLAADAAAYQQVLARAQGGDQDAVGALGDAGSRYLESARAYYASGPQYQALLAGVRASVGGLLDTYTEQQTVEEQQLALLEQQLAAMQAALAQAQAAAAAQAASAAAQLEELRKNRDSLVAQFSKMFTLLQTMPGPTDVGRPDPLGGWMPGEPYPGDTGTGTTGGTTSGGGVGVISRPGDGTVVQEYGPDGWYTGVYANGTRYKIDGQHDVSFSGGIVLVDGRQVDLSQFPTYARGGDHGGGLALVGEEGPELVAMGAARVFDTARTRSLLRDAQPRESLDELRAQNTHLAALVRVSTEAARRTLDELAAVKVAQEETAAELRKLRQQAGR